MVVQDTRQGYCWDNRNIQLPHSITGQGSKISLLIVSHSFVLGMPCCNTKNFKNIRRLSNYANPNANNNYKIFSRENLQSFSHVSVGIFSLVGTIAGINVLSSFMYQPTVEIAVLKTKLEVNNNLAVTKMESVQAELNAEKELRASFQEKMMVLQKNFEQSIELKELKGELVDIAKSHVKAD